MNNQQNEQDDCPFEGTVPIDEPSLAKYLKKAKKPIRNNTLKLHVEDEDIDPNIGIPEKAFQSMKGKLVTENQERALRNLGHEGEIPQDRQEAAIIIGRLIRLKNNG